MKQQSRQLILLLPIWVGIVFLARSCSRPTAPAELIGTWYTGASSYKERYFRIDGRYIALGFGEEQQPQVREITHITVAKSGQIARYLIVSRDDDNGSDEMMIEYHSSNGGEIILRYPKNVAWHRQRSSLD